MYIKLLTFLENVFSTWAVAVGEELRMEKLNQ